MKTLLTLIGIALVSLAGFAGYSLQQPNDTPDTFGAFRPSGYSGKLLTRLNSGGSESTFNTTPCTTPDGQTITANAIGDFIVITVNPGAANEEKISASTVSCSGTTLSWTIANRGLSFASATSTITANKKQHAIGETVIISNDDQFLATQYVDIDGVQTIAALKTFTSGAMFSTAASSTDECTGTSEYCTKNYIDNSVNQGAATSTEALGGIVELATAIEQASSTPTTSNIPYVLQAQNATSTPGYSCNSSGTIGALCTVIARNSGKIHQLWIDLTETFTWTALHTFSGGVTSSATTTLAGSNYLSNALTINTVPMQWPSTMGASFTMLTTDGVGTVSWSNAFNSKLYVTTTQPSTTQDSATTTVLSTTIPANTLGTSNGIRCEFGLGGTSITVQNTATLWIEWSYGGSATTTNAFTQSSGSGQGAYPVVMYLLADGATNAQKLYYQSYGSSSGTNHIFLNGTGTFAVDSTTAKPFYVRAKASGASTYFAPDAIVCESIR